MIESQSVFCPKCRSEEFEFDKYYNEFSCKNCGWIIRDEKKVEIVKNLIFGNQPNESGVTSEAKNYIEINSKNSSVLEEPVDSNNDVCKDEIEQISKPKKISDGKVNRILGFIVAIIILFVIFIGRENLGNLISGTGVRASIENIELTQYTTDRGPIEFDLILKNSNDEQVQVARLEVTGEPSDIEHDISIDKTIPAHGEILIPIHRSGIVSGELITYGKLDPFEIKIKIHVYNKSGKQLTWTQKNVRYK